MKYCIRCGKSFKRKYNFDRHLNRKKKCKIKILNVSYEDIKTNYEELLKIAKNIDFDNNIGKKKVSIMDINIFKEQKKEKSTKEKIYKCKYCNKKFKHSNNMYRHQKHRCKIRNIKKTLHNVISDLDVDYIIIKKSELSSSLKLI